MNEVSGLAPAAQQDPCLTVRTGTRRINDGDRFGMDARLMWPATAPEILQVAATRVMRETAQELKFLPKSLIANVYASVDRNRGITLDAHPFANSSLDTDGNEYEPEDAIVKLYGHNIYNHQTQLVCLSGLIAVSHT